MELAFEMESLEGVDEGVAKLYTEAEGKFLLTGITGISPKSKVDEFRNNNITLTEQLKTFEGIDPAVVKANNTELEELRIRLEKTDTSEEQIAKIVAKRVETMQNEYAEKETAYTTQISSLTETNNKLVIDGQVVTAATEHGIAESAVPDLILRARSVYSIGEDGKAVGKDADGTLYDATGQKPLAINDWVKSLTKTAPHLFKASIQTNIPGIVGFKGDASKLTAMQKIQHGLV